MTDSWPGLVSLYDIRPGNGAGLFLQPRSPHGDSEMLEVSSGVFQAIHLASTEKRTRTTKGHYIKAKNTVKVA